MTSLFAIIAWDSHHSARLRAEHLAAHLAYAESIADKIVVGGPLTDQNGPFRGSLIILTVESEAEAWAVLEADPYHRAGVWAEVEVQPFRAVIGNWIGGKTW